MVPTVKDFLLRQHVAVASLTQATAEDLLAVGPATAPAAPPTGNTE